MTAAALLARLTRAWPDKKMPPETVGVYLDELADIPLPLLEAAVTEIVRTHQWFPTVAAIREVAAERALGLPSEAAALAVVEGLLRVAPGDAGTAPAPPPLVAEALRSMGGLSALRRSEEPRRDLDRFARLYRDLRAETLKTAQLAPSLNPAAAPRALDP